MKEKYPKYNTYFLTYIFFFASLLSGCAGKKIEFSEPPIPKVKENVYFAGFAFLGNWDERNIRYPYTSLIDQSKGSKGISIVSENLLDRISKDFDPKAYKLNLDLGDLKSGQGLSVALAVSYEDVYVLPFEGDYKVSYDLGVNILVFDFKEKKVLAVYPLRFMRNELYNHKPTDKENLNVIQSMLLTDKYGFNVLQETLNQMENLVIKSSYGNYIGIKDIDIHDAVSFIPKDLQKNDVIKTQIAQQFEGALSKSTFIPLVPFTKGEAVGGAMAARFSNGDRYELKLPELDNYINIKLRGFKLKENGTHTGYTSLITIKLENVIKNTFNAHFSNNLWVINAMTGDKSINGQWSIFEESLYKLIDDFSKQVVKSDEVWLKAHSITSDVEDQLEEFREVLIKSQ